MSGPRFRLVAGRGIGERDKPSPAAVRSPQPPPQPVELRVAKEEQNTSSPSPVSQGSQGSIPQVNQIHFNDRMNAGSPLEPVHTGASQPDEIQVVLKCVRFFKTLLNLSRNPEQQNNDEADSGQTTSERVYNLVTDVIFGNCQPEQFTKTLQACLKSQAQPHLLPFLRRTLPSLRDALRRGVVTIEGIETPASWLTPGTSEEKVATSDIVPQPISVSGPVNMIPVSAPVAAPVIPQLPTEVEAEEPREEDAIHVRALQENALKSALIRPEDVMKKITDRMKDACYVEEEVLTLISDAVEYRLREILAELAVLAEHRMDNLRISMTYAPIDDVKGQIRFIENLDRQQFEQSENRDKEQLIRLAKGKGIAKETIEKAKEMQRADAEAKRNRDANAAAIAALSSKSSKPRWDNPTASAAGGGHGPRPKTIRVNLRDLQAFANNDPLCSRSHIVHRLALGGGMQTETI